MCLLGCCVGSFINVVVYRLPIMRAHPQRTGRFNLALPSSNCPHCGRHIKPQHNLPIVSYLWLRGRGACCGEHISRRYVVTEFATGLLSALVYLWLLNQHLDMHSLPAVLTVSWLLLWWLMAITAMLWHSGKNTQVLWQTLLWLGFIADLQRASPILAETILAVCAVYILALLATTSVTFMRRGNESSAAQASYPALDPSWHGLAALVAWFSWPGVEALSLGTAMTVVVIAFGLRFAPNTRDSESTGVWVPRAVQLGIVMAFCVAWLQGFNLLENTYCDASGLRGE